jgi:hypothetical protein
MKGLPNNHKGQSVLDIINVLGANLPCSPEVLSDFGVKSKRMDLG